MRLGRADDLPAAAAELTRRRPGAGHGGGDRREGERRRAISRSATSSSPTAGTAPLPDAFVTLLVSLDPGPAGGALALPRQVPAANWHERETQDLFGIVFVGHPDPRPLVRPRRLAAGLSSRCARRFDAASARPVEPAEEFPHLVVEGEGVFEMPVGPIHAGIIEPGHFRFSSVGETVLHLDARLFYTHRGLEKRIEGLPLARRLLRRRAHLRRVLGLARRSGSARPPSRSPASTSRRARALLRTLALELERLYNHVGDIGNICAGASYHYGTSAGLRMKERCSS